MLFYRAALDLSPATRTFVAELIVGHRDRIGSRWRVLRPGRQALLALVHLRCNETFARLAAAFGVGLATAHRYVTEVIALLAERAPDLREAMRTPQQPALSPDLRRSPLKRLQEVMAKGGRGWRKIGCWVGVAVTLGSSGK